MKQIQRPWWALALQMPAWDTVLSEDHGPDEKRFLITGKPVLKSLTWVIYGPILAVLAVAAGGYYLWAFDVRSHPTPLKLTAVCGMVLLPLLCWLIGGALINKVVEGALARAVAANDQTVILRLNLADRVFQADDLASIPFSQIRGFKLVSDAGVYYDYEQSSGAQMNLMMETEQGQVKLLAKELGSVQQKLQLVSQLEATLEVKA